MGIGFTVYKGSKEGKIIKGTTHRGDLKGDEILVKISHLGVCGTDQHYKTTDMVLGHEGAGTVEEVGPEATTLKKQDSVGWVTNITAVVIASTVDKPIARTDTSFLFKIPAGIKPEDAAPLMCGGATVFNALSMYDVPPTDRVGVIGLGGLGHLATQFAAKMGCEVVVFSRTESKKEEAMKLGAKGFYATKGLKDLKLEKPINHLLVTTSMQPDWSMYLPIMQAGGTIYPLTVSADNLSVPSLPFIQSRSRFQGSIVAPRYIHNKMLEFAAFHGIKPIIMEYPMNVEGMAEAMKTLDEGKMRYRGVLVAQ
ncbi:MAG: hypothetical protein M1827_003679 [Pycnora praestabilis]|nr:MAG: hypothetical protein M1827_003679 [Pycnora praestabilis]